MATITTKNAPQPGFQNSDVKTNTPELPRIAEKQSMELTIIIPVHNEEKRLMNCMKRTIEFCKAQMWDYELIVVEDGSTDGTVNLVRDLILKEDRIRLITNKDKLGKGRAISNAVAFASKEHIGYMDVDLSSDPSEFKRLLLFIDEYDVVVGSRILRGDLPPIERPFIRSFLSSCYSRLFRMLFRKVPIYDPQCGLKLFNSDAANRLLPQIDTSGFAFDCEVIVKAADLGLTIKEVPVIWKHHVGSKVNIFPEIVKMGKDLLLVWYKVRLLKRS